ncbi:MAG: S-layer homology domain-containing protein, partial [Clostridia bacterium]|nr:S-layer homology domain-containing protein [Clostridia bacterium]
MRIFKKAAIILGIMLVLFSVTVTVLNASSAFNDVKQGAWYYDAVNETVEAGVFTGTSKNEFSPTLSMTRAMFVTTL